MMRLGQRKNPGFSDATSRQSGIFTAFIMPPRPYGVLGRGLANLLLQIFRP
ncbi:Uncharacterized protein dnm_058080 [Desulfonema magnum]|uniref:Uncharacterized protein n=1 Tax=Desulfonema magnum TaxID=45655 RepID=A0A975BQF6_9BACT|nr:Uncharacterized protein dnm_058080 [Desulfonema magnum]